MKKRDQLTVTNTSSASRMIATLDHLNFLNNLTLVGLCMVADGCVRKKVGKRTRSESAGDEAP